MRYGIQETHKSDERGRPAGGFTQGCGIDIVWQNGPLVVNGERIEPNGAFVEDVIAAAVGRIEFYQASAFACDENAQAIDSLKTALMWLDLRTKARQARGVEGTHTV